MKDSWTDFEKYVFGELSKISSEISNLKGRAAAWGAIAGLIVSSLGPEIIKAIAGHK